MGIQNQSEVETKALTISDQARAIKIYDNDTYLAAGAFWQQVKATMKEVADTFDPLIEKCHQSHKEALAQKAKYFAPLEGAYKFVKSLMSTYDAEQERIRQAEQRRLEAEARKVEEERQFKAALEAEAAGDKEEAAALIETPAYVPPVVLEKTVPKMTGGPVYRTIWKFRITDISKIPAMYMVPDEVKIGQIVRALKKQANIPGVEPYEERC